MKKERAERLVERFGKKILASDGMKIEKKLTQHGDVSVYQHSLNVARMCIRIAGALPIKVHVGSLIRGALLHDYFLYDWHEPDKSHRLHGFSHAKHAVRNAQRDFGLNRIERNMIASHMFPLNLTIPRYRESLIVGLADKICAVQEGTSSLVRYIRRRARRTVKRR